jgi:hypothetical protein
MIQMSEKPLEEHTVAELRQLASERGVEIPSRSLKADLVKLLSSLEQESDGPNKAMHYW